MPTEQKERQLVKAKNDAEAIHELIKEMGHGTKVTEDESSEGMGYFLCSECGEPIVEYGKDDEPHYFDRRECACPGGHPKHGWRMIQDHEVDHEPK